MEKIFLENSLNKYLRQRNLFLLIGVCLVLSNLMFALAFLRLDNQTILVPGLRQEMSVSKKGVSISYLEEMSLMFLSNLLDLSPGDVAHKKELVLKYTSGNDREYFKDLNEYFVGAENDYKRFGLTTYFTAKNLEIDIENLTVIAHGILTSSWGKSGYKSENEDYKLEFDWYGGILRLKTFERVLSEDRIKKEKTKTRKTNEILGLEEKEDLLSGDKK